MVSHKTTDGVFRIFYVDADVLKQVVGTESLASYNVQFTDTATNYNREVYNDNDIFQTEANDIIDWTESNPFGDPT
jgi:hypothetical protein